MWQVGSAAIGLGASRSDERGEPHQVAGARGPFMPLSVDSSLWIPLCQLRPSSIEHGNVRLRCVQQVGAATPQPTRPLSSHPASSLTNIPDP